MVWSRRVRGGCARSIRRDWRLSGRLKSQGDHALAVYRLLDPGYVGRFYVAAGEVIDGVTKTGGIELSLADFGPAFPTGLLVVQDGNPPSRRQSFKLVEGQVRTASEFEQPILPGPWDVSTSMPRRARHVALQFLRRFPAMIGAGRPVATG